VPTGEFDARRRHQAQAWMWSLIDSGLRRAFHANPTVLAKLPAIRQAVDEARQTPTSAARQLLGAFLGTTLAQTSPTTHGLGS
jgi:LAO/AO transport system kinase